MWPSIITVHDLIDPSELDTISDTISEASFVDGSVSAGGVNLAVKTNREMAPEQTYVAVVKVIEQAIRQNVVLNYAVFPRTITRAIISRYDVGMSYGEHIDSPVMGFMTQGRAVGPFGQNYVRSDFSMTVFLADVDSYDGGELAFESPWGVQTYKLPPGSAVVYPTGIPHSVTPVTRGTRLAAVLWIQSMIRDHEQRRLVADLNRFARHLTSVDPDSQEAATARDLASTALRLSADV